MLLRHPRSAAEYFKAKDPNTAISESFIRKLIRNGDIGVVRNGTKILIDVESIEAYLENELKD